MPFDIKELIHDKRLMAVAGAGAAFGGYTLYKKRAGSAGGSASNGAATTASGSAYVPGQFGGYDSSATDAYNNIQTSVDNQLQGFTSQITGLSDQLGKIQNGTTTNTMTPVISWKAPTTYTADSVARKYGLTIDQLQALNVGHNIKAGIVKGATINVPLK